MQQFIIDPFFWFSDRRLEYTPKHFVITNTPATTESLLWVINNFKGRYSLISEYLNYDDILSIIADFDIGMLAFEDPTEAVFYELKWS